MGERRRCILTVDATEAAKRPDAKVVLAARLQERARAVSPDSGEEELINFESDENILRKHKEKKMTKSDKALQREISRAEVRERLDKRREEEKRARREAQDRERREREKRKRAPDPLADFPGMFDRKRPCLPPSRPCLPSPLPANLPQTLLKLALDCDYYFLSHHNCITMHKPLELQAVVRGNREVLHCVVSREWGIVKAIDADLERGEAWICTERH